MKNILILLFLLSPFAQAQRLKLSPPTMQEFLNGIEQEQVQEAVQGRHFSYQQMQQLLDEVEASDQAPGEVPYHTVTKMITLDRFQPQACENILQDLQAAGYKAKGANSQLCEASNPDERFITIYMSVPYHDQYRVEVRKDMIHHFRDSWIGNPNLEGKNKQIRGTVLVGAGALMVLAAMDEEETGWNRDNLKKPWKHYFDNVTAGPRRDSDNKMFNYVLHPYAGAAYYMQSRTTGGSRLESFGFSVLMSTVFWEYGWEAIMERPSKQDLVITPIVGSLVGELFYQAHQSIAQNNGKVFGSKALGRIVQFFLNPLGQLADQINKILGEKFFRDARTFPGMAYRQDPFSGKTQGYPALFFHAQW